MVWDVRQKDTPVAKFLPTEGTTARDCWSVAFGNSYNNEERVIAAGYDNGDIKIYDLKNMSLLWSKCVKNGVKNIYFFNIQYKYLCKLFKLVELFKYLKVMLIEVKFFVFFYSFLYITL